MENKTQSKKSKFKHKNKHKVSKINEEKQEIEELQAKYATITKSTIENIRNFSDMPLSKRTLKGLKTAGYDEPTDIQREAIPWALAGKDILGAARTGSGKTIAFLVPLLEKLYCQQWTKLDGCGAIVISPTRELSKQIFECLRNVGHFHDFTSGLVIGGQGLKEEQKLIDQCNIVICTPGRLLHHMDTNYLFMANNNLQLLVLDEADRCLDMGFQREINAIVENLPAERQTLLFSATQKTSIQNLARLSLKDPTYCSVHENSKFSTPESLEQSYVICELKDKVSILWSFIRRHKHKKIIIFLSNCKSVKFFYEMFCKMQPGITLMASYGTLHQARRNTIYDTFHDKSSAVLFATDLVSRGLDFPKVNWVVQADCPEDVDTYIHRVGRTARYQEGGESLLLLLPTEVSIVEQLEERKVPINEIKINPNEMFNPLSKMEGLLAKNFELKETAQRAVVSYAKAVAKIKQPFFDVHALDIEGFSKSLGLAVTPRLRFLEKLTKQTQKQTKVAKKSKGEMDKSTNQPVKFNNDSDSDDDILQIKREDHNIDLPSEDEIEEEKAIANKKKKVTTKVAKAKKILKKQIVANKKITFGDDGEVELGFKDKKSKLAQDYEKEAEAGIDIEKAKAMLKEEDQHDKMLYKEKVKLKHRAEKLKKKLAKQKEEEEEMDEFGDGSESDEDKLDWLPDPDEIYDKNSVEDVEDVEELKKTVTTGSKRKMKNIEEPPELVKKKKKKLPIGNTNKLSVNEAEELAMMLLNSGGK